MPGDYIVNDHIGSDSFRHVLPSQQLIETARLCRISLV
jgi:hypothetical protein